MNYQGGDIVQGLYKVGTEVRFEFCEAIRNLSVETASHLRIDLTIALSASVYDEREENNIRNFEVESQTYNFRVDPDFPAAIIEDQMSQLIDLLSAPEAVHNDFFKDSGVTIEGTLDHVNVNVMILDHLPPTDEDYDVDETLSETEEETEVTPRNSLASKHFTYAVFYAARGLKKPGKQNIRQNFLSDNFMFDDIHKVCAGNDVYEFIAKYPTLFSKHRWVFLTSYGNAFYIHNPEKTDSKYLEYDGTANMWRYVYLVRQRFSVQRNKKFCSVCKFWHGIQKCYKAKGTYSIADTYKRFIYPGKSDIVMYGDWESYINDGIHLPAGLTIVTIKNGVSKTQSMIGETYVDYGRFIVEIAMGLQDEPKIRTHTCINCGREDVVTYNGYCIVCWRLRFGVIPFLFHNATGYDNAHTFKAVESWLAFFTTEENYKGPNVIAKSINKFESIQWQLSNKFFLTVRDSAKHLLGSLDSLAQHLQSSQFKISTQHTNKGVFPYEWFDSLAKLDATELPTEKEDWYNTLTQSYMSREKAQEAWDFIGCTSFREYLKYYMELDTTLLADIFENYRETCLETWQTDPVFFHGMPSLGYYACRALMGNQEASWCSFPNAGKEIFDLYWQNIRGGITNSIKRYQKKGTGQILYLDVNSLYGSCMANYSYPIGASILALKIDDEVDGLVKLGELLTDPMFNDENMGAHCFVSYNWPIHEHDSQPLPLSERKEGNGLSNNFYPVEHQLHSLFRIKQMIEHGISITGCAGIYIFEYAPKYQAYILGCMEQRAIAQQNGDAARSNTFKLANNATYGKTCENPRKYTNLIIAADGGVVQHATSARSIELPMKTLHSGIFPQNDSKTSKNPWDGFEILERSKQIFYDGVKRFTSLPGTELLYCDTDSVIIYNPQPTFYEDLKIFPLTKDLIVEDKTFGKWQLEFPPDKITEYISTTQKCYFLGFDDDTSMKKHKGITRKTNLTREDYYSAIFDSEQVFKEQVQLRLDSLEVKTTKFQKLALSTKNNKRIVLDGGVYTVAYGYRGARFDIGGAGGHDISREQKNLEGDDIPGAN